MADEDPYQSNTFYDEDPFAIKSVVEETTLVKTIEAPTSIPVTASVDKGVDIDATKITAQEEVDPFDVEDVDPFANSEAVANEVDPFGAEEVDPFAIDNTAVEKVDQFANTVENSATTVTTSAHVETPIANLNSRHSMDDLNAFGAETVPKENASHSPLPAETITTCSGEHEDYGDYVSANIDLVSFYEMKVGADYHQERRASQTDVPVVSTGPKKLKGKWIIDRKTVPTAFGYVKNVTNWKFYVKGIQYEIELRHSVTSGKRVITVNGDTIINEKVLLGGSDFKHKFAAGVGNKKTIICVAMQCTTDGKWNYGIFIDGLPIREAKNKLAEYSTR